jgi:heat shock protein HslJ
VSTLTSGGGAPASVLQVAEWNVVEIVRRRCLPALVAAACCVAGCSPGAPPEGASAASAGPAASAPAQPAAVPAVDTGAQLAAYAWRIESATDSAGRSIAAFFPADHPLGIAFGDSRVGVIGGCNRMGAAYRLLDAAKMEVSPGLSTMMACPPPLAKADAAFAQFLRGALRVAVEGDAGAPRLRLAAADGSVLTFQGTPTPETRFGGPGQRAFLEVSPVPCVPPAAPERPCLTVRDRRFDENGLPSGPPGEWRSLPDGIEGYAPVDGEQTVLRVKRFEVATAAGEPKVHYVLDLVVETRTVP